MARGECKRTRESEPKPWCGLSSWKYRDERPVSVWVYEVEFHLWHLILLSCHWRLNSGRVTKSWELGYWGCVGGADSAEAGPNQRRQLYRSLVKWHLHKTPTPTSTSNKIETNFDPSSSLNFRVCRLLYLSVNSAAWACFSLIFSTHLQLWGEFQFYPKRPHVTYRGLRA